MMQHVDRFLNRFTMYRLTLYYLAALLALGFGLSFFGVVSGGPVAVVSTTGILLASCWLANLLLSRIWKVRANPESSLITALILALISGPVSVLADPRHAAVLALSGAAAVASKYLLAFRRQHALNPAAFGAFISAVAFGTYATWWVGNAAMLPLVAVGGFLLVRKISRFRFLGAFLLAFVVSMAALSFAQGLSLGMVLQSVGFVFRQSALVFFAVVMLTEPMTSPKRLALQVLYGAIVAFLYQPLLTMFGQNLTPEEALLVGNLFSFFVSPSRKLKLSLKGRKEEGTGITSFTFPRPPAFSYRAGQYMEWGLPIRRADSRGTRRYFSLASSPTEPDLLIAARIPTDPSSYKEALERLSVGDRILAGELGGDFVLPRDPRVPLAFIAGGIGITPVRAMIRHMLDTGEGRDIVLFYSNRTEQEIAFRCVFDEAARTAGLHAVYTLTDLARVRPSWCGGRGPIDADMIRTEAPGYASRRFYISGPPAMVNGMKAVLRSMGVHRGNIRSDSFTGY